MAFLFCRKGRNETHDHRYRGFLLRETQENQYVSVVIPCILYKLAAQMGWRKAVKANGGTWKDLGNKPE